MRPNNGNGVPQHPVISTALWDPLFFAHFLSFLPSRFYSFYGVELRARHRSAFSWKDTESTSSELALARLGVTWVVARSKSVRMYSTFPIFVVFNGPVPPSVRRMRVAVIASVHKREAAVLEPTSAVSGSACAEFQQGSDACRKTEVPSISFMVEFELSAMYIAF